MPPGTLTAAFLTGKGHVLHCESNIMLTRTSNTENMLRAILYKVVTYLIVLISLHNAVAHTVTCIEVSYRSVIL